MWYPFKWGMPWTQVCLYPINIKLIACLLNYGRMKHEASFGGPVLSLYRLLSLTESDIRYRSDKNSPIHIALPFDSFIKLFSSYSCKSKQRGQNKSMKDFSKNFLPQISTFWVLQIITWHASIDKINALLDKVLYCVRNLWSIFGDTSIVWILFNYQDKTVHEMSVRVCNRIREKIQS